MSDRVRLAITIAGAIVLAMGIALSFDWQRPYWAGLAVVVIGLPTMGESVFKGLQRLAGTAVAIPVALLFISLFAQDRWHFAIATSLWVGFCVWRMQVDKDHFYFWTCCGFIVPLLSFMSGFDSVRSFYTVETRAKETVLGVLCFIVVGLLMSHRPSYGKFVDGIEEQLALLRQKVGDVRRMALGQERASDMAERNAAIARNFMSLGSLYTSAKLESFELRERAAAWLQLRSRLHQLSTSIDRLDLTFDIGSGSSDKLSARPGLILVLDEIEARLQAAADLLKGEQQVREPRPLGNPQSIAAANPVSPFQRGEALVRNDILTGLDAETRSLQQAAADIADKQRLVDTPAIRPTHQWSTLIPNPEHLATALLVVVVFWFAFLLYIYVPSLPDGTVVVIAAGSIGINICRMPWVPAYKLLVPVIVASIYGSVAHILIMPHLSGYVQLGAMLFIGTFLLVWLFYKDEQQTARTLSVILFLMTIQVTNQQTYSATYAMNIVIAFAIILLLITLAQRWPVSFKPEHVVQRLLNRYSRCILGILNGMRWDAPLQSTWIARQLRGYYMNQLLTIPANLSFWIGKLSPAAASSQDREELLKLVDRLSVLSYRMSDLAELRSQRPDKAWAELLSEEIRGWRQGIARVLPTLIGGGDYDPAEMRRRLDARLVRLEQLIADAAQSGTADAASDEGTAHMQRVLSAYRGVSFAVMSVADRARRITWDRLVENRF